MRTTKNKLILAAVSTATLILSAGTAVALTNDDNTPTRGATQTPTSTTAAATTTPSCSPEHDDHGRHGHDDSPGDDSGHGH